MAAQLGVRPSSYVCDRCEQTYPVGSRGKIPTRCRRYRLAADFQTRQQNRSNQELAGLMAIRCTEMRVAVNNARTVLSVALQDGGSRTRLEAAVRVALADLEAVTPD